METSPDALAEKPTPQKLERCSAEQWENLFNEFWLGLGTGYPAQQGQAAVYFQQLQRYPLLILWEMLDNFMCRKTLITLSTRSFAPCPAIADMMAECSAIMHEKKLNRSQQQEKEPQSAITSTDYKHELMTGTARILRTNAGSRKNECGTKIGELIENLKKKYGIK